MVKFIQILFYTLLFALIIPNGTIFNIDIKIISVFLLVVLIGIVNFKQIILDKKFISISFIYFVALLIWSIIGWNNGFYFINQLKSFLQIYLIMFINYQIFKSKMIECEKLKNVIYLIAFIKIVAKILIEVLFISNILNFTQIEQIYQILFDTVPVFGHISNTGLIRIQTYVDIFPLIVYSFFMLDPNKGKYLKLIGTILLCPYIIIVYSRLFIIQYIVICLILLIYFFKKYRVIELIKSMNKFVVVTVLIGLLGFTYYQASFGTVHDIISHRFNSSEVDKSDSVRDFQAYYLIESYKESSLLGKGMGAYISEHTTTDLESNKFAYEKEYLSFLMQFGIIGFIILIIGTIALCVFCSNRVIRWKRIESIVLVMCVFNFIFYLIKPIFNPFFYTIYIDMTIIISFAYIYNYKKIDNVIIDN